MPTRRSPDDLAIQTLLTLSGQEHPAGDPVTPFEHALGEFQPNYQEWDYLYWGWFDDAETIWPVGRVKVEVELTRDLRAAKASGQHGARINDRGKKPSKVKIEVYL